MSTHSSFETHHDHCIACGPSHSVQSLHLEFDWIDPLTLHSCFYVDGSYQGYDHLLHGGVASTLLDSAMTHFLLAHHVAAMTVDLNIRYHKPVVIGQVVDIYAKQDQCRHGIYWMQSGIFSHEHALVTAKARFKVPEASRNMAHS
ncbi:PaaI family thioesterase [Celerinatantimonas sp. YJH-8]|uniref:PaaI family thioesterase n=1 Tax=Celerinatantimonas sp. YJH-8 TaxID=3228714 RepID=UPI0038BFE9CB